MINTWYEFFEELATKIYEEYKDVPNSDRAGKFADWIKNNIKDTKRFRSDEIGNLDMFDPFSFFSAIIPESEKINKRVYNRGEIWQKLCSLLNIENLASNISDNGLTRRNSQLSYFFIWNCPRSDFEKLWKMFYSAIEYSFDPNDVNLKKEFVTAFADALKVKNTGIASLTMGLFWIRPRFYISLDGKCWQYAKEYNILGLPQNVSDIDGESYLKLLEELCNIGKTPVEFSIEAWKYSENGEQNPNTSKEKEISQPSISNISTTLCAGAYNKIFYGVPGCGKSYHIEHDVLDGIFANYQNCRTSNTFRTIFYQDYSHADFVGQYMPRRNKTTGQVEYDFVPKVFTKALERAYKKPEEPVVLIIEEINRGDAASIFGDLFQLLDRDKSGKSEYEIDCDEIVDYLSDVENKSETITSIVGENEIEGTNKIYIPSNLYLFATMNTCDQNVFALDTAFKRRWNMEEIPNEFNGHKIKDMCVPYDFGGKYITWEKFVEVVNEQIIDKSDEFFGDDRQIGCFFVDETCLFDATNGMSANKTEANNFAYNVISYLWNDVAKLNRNEWFDDAVKTLHGAIDGFKNGKDVFAKDLYNKF